MNTMILNYLLTEEKMSDTIATRSMEKFGRHPDILSEFRIWIETRQYPENAAICVEGYTAQMLTNTTYLRPVGAYNYLIYLRERPEEALENLRRGLPRK